MLRIDDELRRSARSGMVKVCLVAVLGVADAFIIKARRTLPAWVNDDLALDGLELVESNYEWYLGPLGE